MEGTDGNRRARFVSVTELAGIQQAAIFDAAERRRNEAPKELLRLLRRLIDRLNDTAIADQRWQSSQVDALTELMMPLWRELRIEQPGLWVDRGSDYGQATPCKLFHVRDPDLEDYPSTMLEHEEGEKRYVATVGDVAIMLPEILTWEKWLEQKFDLKSIPIALGRSLNARPIAENEALANAKSRPRKDSKKRPESTGDTFEAWKAYLLVHHKYGSDLNQTPATPTSIQNAEICSKAQASRHFKTKWGGHKQYVRYCADIKRLGVELKLLAGDMSVVGMGSLIQELKDSTAQDPRNCIEDD
ncbi:hypothetical protein EC9_02580 [Rosistilla ulvae]|uniref:Uncharacterized protein n=1 Tax=Rosistilla ulvae TaxID=1930277 RepID=A0A517LU01_9BACT|nr:hypothetical protein [Rosistilla ulvae]QDS86100.1 hypothetical protein EC9_02580 [Rosistilla ulvae]